LRDVQNAYLRLKQLYSDSSVVLEPLEEDFTDAKREKVLEEIEEAYRYLLAVFRAEPSRSSGFPGDGPPAEEPAEEPAEKLTYSGVALRKTRERLGIALAEISKELKLRPDLLCGIEEERFQALPEEAYLKGHLKEYARLLGLDPARVLDDYLKRYRAWRTAKR
jgi:hypothetical protein